MYSGLTISKRSGYLIGSHQKFDRIARSALKPYLLDNKAFPSKKAIVHFEGWNGPDGLKKKSPGKDEPWHHYDPFDPEDYELLDIIQEHYKNLVKELKRKNKERAAFEAAWLGHALLDGMTPAHHFPLEEELEKIRGEGKETRTSVYKKAIAPGANTLEIIKNTWAIWGVKGLITTHFLFEGGLVGLVFIAPKRTAYPNKYELKTILHIGLIEYFKREAREIASLNLYDNFYEKGWTNKLAKTLKKELIPRMAVMTTLAWYLAAYEAGLATGEI